MSIDREQLSQMVEWLRHQAAAFKQTNHIVEVLLGDLCAAPANSFKEFVARHGISFETYDGMSIDEKFNCAQLILSKQSTRTQNLISALDLIFEARYGWPEGTVGQLTLPDILLALDHAIEYDSPERQSLWEITK
jgi:hypothetical protein